MKITVTAPALATQGQLSFAGKNYACVLGRGGIISAAQKQEGDGATPAGIWPLRRVFYRPDKMAAPQTALPVVPINPSSGWCDDPTHQDYNTLINLPHPARHEQMWRIDDVYNLIIELGYNDQPIIPHKGSAIFMHLMQPQRTPTEGCVALSGADLLDIVQRLSADSIIEILLRD